jgi:DNA-binding response OmpR family regulator
MSRPAILVVEDDEAIASGLVRVLDSQGYAVRRVARGRPALAAAGADVGLVILDLGLPDMDGIDVCRRLRAARPDLAILILTARDQELDVVSGLDAGADDYLIKPFRLAELLARIRAHMRRADSVAAHEPGEPLTAGDLTVDLPARRAWRAGAELALRPKEFDLLALLVAEAGRVVTRERIMGEVWDTDWLGATKTLSSCPRAAARSRSTPRRGGASRVAPDRRPRTTSCARRCGARARPIACGTVS